MADWGWLQYGSFGLLAMILIVVGVYVRKQLSDSSEFTRQLITRFLEASETNQAALKQVAERAIIGIERNTATMEELVKESRETRSTMGELAKESRERRNESQANFQKICAELVAVRKAQASARRRAGVE